MDLETNGVHRKVNAVQDTTDLRDKKYSPALLELKSSLFPDKKLIHILDQETEGACTGFALAAVINMQNNLRFTPSNVGSTVQPVSARMLYEMAKLHDEWRGSEYAGSSVRGAIKGFFHNGVCTEKSAPYFSNQKEWHLTIDQAKEARNIGLGAYYRLLPIVNDYHAALNEVGALIVSARIHSGWRDPKGGVIVKSNRGEGAHAFAIVGYDAEGFIVQNSWGNNWSRFGDVSGLAHWSYEDWAENIMDAWVLRLAVSSPTAFDVKYSNTGKIHDSSERQEVFWPRRSEISGHFIHIDNGKLVGRGKYHTRRDSILETADHLAKNVKNASDKKYQHLLIYMHGGLNGPKESARRIKAWKNVFKRNKIYPIHFMWETGFTHELIDIVKDLIFKTQERVGSSTDDFDRTFEDLARPIGSKLWKEMKIGAAEVFYRNGGGSWALKQLFDAITLNGNQQMKVHLVGQSAGSILIGEMIDRMNKSFPKTIVSTCSVKGAACSVDFYKKKIMPFIGSSRKIREFHQYNLTDRRERDDNVAIYQKSLLYLIHHAFEAEFKTPLLGMEVSSSKFNLPSKHSIYYAGRDRTRCESSSHGGFDNDRATMNSILRDILSEEYNAGLTFQTGELRGY